MSQSKLRDRAARAWRDEAGSATVEFAILFPVFMAILTGMAWLALYLLTIANVQQLTHEVARQSLQHHGGALSRAELCATIPPRRRLVLLGDSLLALCVAPGLQERQQAGGALMAVDHGLT